MSQFEIAYDSTDHFTLICDKCQLPCTVKRVMTAKPTIDFKGTRDKCTWIVAICGKCKQQNQRKIYWTSDIHDGRDQNGRVNWKREYIQLKSESGRRNKNGKRN